MAENVCPNFNLQSYRFTDSEQDSCLQSLRTCLASFGKDFLYDPLEYSVKELMENAKKANLKRAFFFDRKTNIEDPGEYEKTMPDFRAAVTKDIPRFEEILEKMKLYVRVQYGLRDGIFTIDVFNNTMILDAERQRIADRVTRARACRNMGEAFMQFSDSLESAGLGIITIILMLRKLGIPDENFKIFRISDKGETLSRIVVPLNTVTEAQAEQISDKITAEVEFLPKFPESILELQKMLSNPDIAFTEVGKVIQRDPAITADLLKIVNSVQFMLPNKVSNISQAVSLIGKKGLRDLLYTYGAQSIMDTKFSRMTEIWDHSAKVAFYSYQLAKNARLTNVLDEAYTAGILHDLGKIVVNFFNPGFSEKLSRFCAEKGVSGNFIENLSLGISHQKIGAMIGRKWQLPDPITTAIEFHHQPLLAPDDRRVIASVVYTADFLVRAEEGLKQFKTYARDVLKIMNLANLESLKTAGDKVKAMYEQQKEKFK